MRSFLSENRAPVLLVALLVGFLMLLSAQVRVPDAGGGLRTGLLTVFSPVAKAGAAVVRGVSGAWSGYVALRDLRRENLALRRQMVRLQVRNQLLQEAAGEAVRLQALLELQPLAPAPTLAARVVALDLEGAFRVAILDKGWQAGVAVDDGVITPDGVVGRVTAVAPGAATVQLLVDPTSGVAAQVERTRVQGLVVGRGESDLEMQYVSSLSDVVPGDQVATSGLDGIYPKGLPLGLVSMVDAGEGLQRRIRVAPAVDFRTLEAVLVLSGEKAAAASPREDAGEQP